MGIDAIEVRAVTVHSTQDQSSPDVALIPEKTNSIQLSINSFSRDCAEHVFHYNVMCSSVSSLPEEHLFEHAISSGYAWQPARGEGVQLQVGGDNLSGHLCVCSCSCSTTAG